MKTAMCYRWKALFIVTMLRSLDLYAPTQLVGVNQGGTGNDVKPLRGIQPDRRAASPSCLALALATRCSSGRRAVMVAKNLGPAYVAALGITRQAQ